MTKLKNAGWLLREEGGGEHVVHSIEFKSDLIWLWATESVMIVYDLEKRLGYAAVVYANYVEPEGELRHLDLYKNSVSAEWFQNWLWMTEEQKKEMLRLIQQVVSTRAEQFPEPYKSVWKIAHGYAKNLFIQHPGKNKLSPKIGIKGRLRKQVD